jgi:hypothetical protein
MPRQKCIHPTKLEDLEKKLLLLSTSYSIDLLDPTQFTEYVCYCSKCKHMVSFSYNPFSRELHENHTPKNHEKFLKTEFKEVIEKLSYTSVW